MGGVIFTVEPDQDRRGSGGLFLPYKLPDDKQADDKQSDDKLPDGPC